MCDEFFEAIEDQIDIAEARKALADSHGDRIGLDELWAAFDASWNTNAAGYRHLADL